MAVEPDVVVTFTVRLMTVSRSNSGTETGAETSNCGLVLASALAWVVKMRRTAWASVVSPEGSTKSHWRVGRVTEMIWPLLGLRLSGWSGLSDQTTSNSGRNWSAAWAEYIHFAAVVSTEMRKP